jgi:hypothetical protein
MHITPAAPAAVPAVDPAVRAQVEQFADLVGTAYQLSPVYWSDARTYGQQAAAFGAALLPKLSGVLLDFTSASVEWLQRANATWGTTAKDPYWMARGQANAAVEALDGYHEGDTATHPRPLPAHG